MDEEKLERLKQHGIKSILFLEKKGDSSYYEAFAGAEILLIIDKDKEQVAFIYRNLERTFREGIISSSALLTKWYRNIPDNARDRWDYICRKAGLEEGFVHNLLADFSTEVLLAEIERRTEALLAEIERR